MKTDLISILWLALSLAAPTGYAETITAVPFTIKKSGTYTFDQNLTSAGDGGAIVVEASNVVIDLTGFVLASSTGSGTGVFNNAESANIIIQNGTISGFEFGVLLEHSRRWAIRNLFLTNNVGGVNLARCVNGSVQNCFVLGSGATDSFGIAMNGCTGVEVKHNQVLDWDIGISSESGRPNGGGSAFLENYLGICTTGLQLGTADKYQGNVTNGCTTPFSGGTVVGHENN